MDARRPARLRHTEHYAYVKIAEGCDYKCAFCIIRRSVARIAAAPKISGPRARALAARGVKELLLDLAGHHVLRHRPHERGALARLLRQFERGGGRRVIRLLYLYPTIDEDTLAAMADCARSASTSTCRCSTHRIRS